MTPSSPGWVVEFYTDARGRSPVAEYLATLPEAERARVRNAIRLLRELGTELSGPLVKPMQGHRGLWELRPGPHRVFYFLHTGRRFILLHAFRKQGQKTPAREIATATRRRAEIEGRER